MFAISGYQLERYSKRKIARAPAAMHIAAKQRSVEARDPAQLRQLRETEAVRRGAGANGDGSAATDEALCRYELDMRLLQVGSPPSHGHGPIRV